MISKNDENSKIFVATGIATNVVSSVSIIQLNKYIYVNYGYPNMALTCLHFIITFIGLLICNRLGLFQIKKVPIKEMLPMSLTFCGFVVLTNYSLQFNSVGTYQCLKSLTTPFVIFITIYFYNVKYSTQVKLTVVPVLFGIFFNSMYDIKFNFAGLLIGLFGAIITSLYQVWVGTKQKDLQLNALQLLFYQAPLSAILLAFIIPFFEPLTGSHGVFYMSRTTNEWIVILISGLMGFLVNISIYWIIGTTSVLTYNMIGHLKFKLIIAFGFFLFKDPIKAEQAAAIFCVLLGLISYSYFRLKENEEENQSIKIISQQQDNLEKQLLDDSKAQENE